LLADVHDVFGLGEHITGIVYNVFHFLKSGWQCQYSAITFAAMCLGVLILIYHAVVAVLQACFWVCWSLESLSRGIQRYHAAGWGHYLWLQVAYLLIPSTQWFM